MAVKKALVKTGFQKGTSQNWVVKRFPKTYFKPGNTRGSPDVRTRGTSEVKTLIFFLHSGNIDATKL